MTDLPTPTTSQPSADGTTSQTDILTDDRPLEYFSKRDQVLALEAVWVGVQRPQGTFSELAAKALNKVQKATRDGTLQGLYDGWTRDPDGD